MRKTAITLLALGLAAVLASPAMAVSFWSETFSYANGNLAIAPNVSGGLWTSHSGTAGTDIQVTSTVAVGNMAAAYDDNRTFTAQDSLAKTYACFNVMIPSITGSPRTNYFAHFKDSGFNFGARVFVAPQGTTFSFGLSVNSPTMGVQWPTALNYGQWYTVAISYDGATDTAELWVDPSSEASTKISITTAGASFFVSAFALRQSNTGTGTLWTYNVDNIQVGTTFSDLCPNPTPTNNTTWGRLKAIYR